MDRYPLRTKGELPQDPVPVITDIQTYDNTTQMQQTISNSQAHEVVSILPDPDSRASLLTLNPQASRLNTNEIAHYMTDRDRTDEKLATDNTF